MQDRFIWTFLMDTKLSDWLLATYGSRTPNPDLVRWRDAAELFPGAKSEKVRKRYMGVLVAKRRDAITEEEASKLLSLIKVYGFAWEEMAK